MAGNINTVNPSAMSAEALEYQRQLGEIAKQYASQRDDIKAEYNNLEAIMSNIIEGLKSKNKKDQKKYEELFNIVKTANKNVVEENVRLKSIIDVLQSQITSKAIKTDIDSFRQKMSEHKSISDEVEKWLTIENDTRRDDEERKKAKETREIFEKKQEDLQIAIEELRIKYDSIGIQNQQAELNGIISDAQAKIDDAQDRINNAVLKSTSAKTPDEKRDALKEKEIAENDKKKAEEDKRNAEEQYNQLSIGKSAIENMVGLSKLSDDVKDASGAFGKLSEEVEKTNKELEKSAQNAVSFREAIIAGSRAIISFGKEINDIWNYYDDIAVKQGRAYGMLSDELEIYRRRQMEIAKDIGDKFGMTKEETVKLQDDYINTTGKVRLLDKQAIESVAAMSKLASPEIAKSTIDVFDKFGGSAEVAMASAYSTYEMASKAGLDASKTSDAFVKNMELAQTMTFSGGVDGVKRMTALSETLKLNMQAVAAASSKFSSISDAIKTSANLQMLGNTFAMNFGNPLDALYESLNDIEGFTTRVTDMWKGKGTFNTKTGMVETSGYDKALVKASAEAIGMSMEDAMKVVNQQVRNERINSELNTYVRNNLTDEQKMSIYNKSQWDVDKGAHVITYMTQEGDVISKNISEITANEIDQIIHSGSVDSMSQNVFDIAGNVRKISDRLINRGMNSKSYLEIRSGIKTRWDAENARQIDSIKGYIKQEINDVINGESVLSPIYEGIQKANVILKGIAIGVGAMVAYFVKTWMHNFITNIATNKSGFSSLRSTVSSGFESVKAKIGTGGGSGVGGQGGRLGGWGKFARIGGGLALAAAGAYVAKRYFDTQDDISTGRRTLNGKDDYSVLQGLSSGAMIGAGIGLTLGGGYGALAGGLIGGAVGGVGSLVKRNNMLNNVYGDGRIHGDTQSMDPSELTASNTNNMLTAIDSSRNILNDISNDTRKMANIMYSNQSDGTAIPANNRYTNNMMESSYSLTSIGGVNIRNVAHTRSNMSSVSEIVTNENMGSSIIIPQCEVVKIEPKSIDYIHPTVAPFANVGGTDGNGGKIEVDPIKIDISGKISLDGGSSKEEIDVDKLMNTPGFKNKLVEIINQKILAMAGEIMTNNQALMARRGGV